MDEPAAKRAKMSPVTKVAEADPLSCVSGAAESCEAAGSCAQPAEKEAKPVMAVEQAAAGAPGGDNNGLGLLLSQPHRPAVRLHDSAALGTTEEGAGKKGAGLLTKLQGFTRRVLVLLT